MTNPIIVYLFSGKRKSGKDYLTDMLFSKLDKNVAVIIKISGPIKSYWAKTNNLSFDELLDSTEFKEQHRKDMLKWSEALRNKDYGYFCSAAISMYKADEKPIWIVSDVRRRTDIKWFKEHYGDSVKTVRVTCNNNLRKARGWIYTQGVDDAETECDLDNMEQWDHVLNNDGTIETEELLNEILQDIMNLNKNLS